MNISPFQIVKSKHQSKEKLVDQLMSSLERKEGESKEALKKRLLKVSSRKLLKFAARKETQKEKKSKS